MTWFLLKILDLFEWLYTWQSVDFRQLRAIVGIKLEMDNRRPQSFRTQQTQKETSASFILTLFFSLLFGLVMSFIIGSFQSVIFSFTLYHAFLMVMITMMLIGDFSSVLLDTSDNTIILPRPVSAKTFYAARTTHILLYIGQLGISLSLIPVIVTFYFYGPAVGLTVIVTSVLSIVFSVMLTNGLYLVIMRFTSEERLKSIINYFQIVMTIMMMGGYQLLPRFLGGGDSLKTITEFQWWATLLPPMWMAGAVKLVNDLLPEPRTIILAVMALAVPVASWSAVGKYLTPHFTAKLADLGTGSGTRVSRKPKKQKSGIIDLKTLLTGSGAERAAFSLAGIAMARDRKLKLRISPAIGSLFILLIIFVLPMKTGDTSFAELIHNLGQSKIYLIMIYMVILIVSTVLFEINFSEEYKAATVYFSAPLERPGEILTGVLKAVFAKFFLPIYAIVSVMVLLIWGKKAIVDLLFGGLASMLLMLLLSTISDKQFLLSIAPNARNQSGSFVRAIVSFILIAAMCGLHYLMTKWSILLWIACPAMVAGIYFLLVLHRKMELADFES